MKIIVFGYKQHGKDTACEYLRDHLGISFSASSEYACDKFLFAQLRDQFGYATRDECFADRVNHRKVWYEAIREYNRGDLARMGREIFAQSDVYCGIRDREEFLAMKAEGLFDLAVWIDASERKEPEGLESMKLSREDADIVLTNNGTLEDFHQTLDRFFRPLVQIMAERTSPTTNTCVKRAMKLKKGAWVASYDGQGDLEALPEIAQVRDVYEDGCLDLVMFSRTGERLGRTSPAMGGPRSFEPYCSDEFWVPIEKPDFEALSAIRGGHPYRHLLTWKSYEIDVAREAKNVAKEVLANMDGAQFKCNRRPGARMPA